MMGLSYGAVAKSTQKKQQGASGEDACCRLVMSRSLVDPLFQDLTSSHRYYLSYFASSLFKDLVIYDTPNYNPLRDLIPMSGEHAVLRYIMIASSALHISNVSRKANSSLTKTPTYSSAMISSQSMEHASPTSYRDGLIAKQRALQLLSTALNDMRTELVDIALATVLLFIECDLLDSGNNDWRFHINGARTIIGTLGQHSKLGDVKMSSLRRCLISNCLVYDIFGSVSTCPKLLETPQSIRFDITPLLRFAEANNYLSCPAVLLQTLLAASQISRNLPNELASNETFKVAKERTEALLWTTQSFDPLSWATELQKISPQYDLDSRIHIASAHKAAVCIYISRILLSFSPNSESYENFEPLVSDIILHLSFISQEDPLYKSITWPTFVAGAETRDPERQAWAMTRLHQLWGILLWGYTRNIMGVLAGVWEKRVTPVGPGSSALDWIQDLMTLEFDCLIA
ncbi:hypothetical protein BP5796_09716 [Coleophoma crateriformis]|uniref:Acriflavine sensitivity control protein acr-2 n=1 Tax=Coleophoma crateriformis TaxID=565419 RepID=A0A3D8QYW8_9HELO|nr:hypothetical protein BP5796_09716 [Coleophoma crateriformis]